jgi:hypothetical protein
VIRQLRNKLEFPEKNRAKALAYYHAKRKGQPRYDDRKRSLEKAFRRSIRPPKLVRVSLTELERLGRAAKKVFNSHAHRKLIKGLRRRLENFTKRAKINVGTSISRAAQSFLGCSISGLRVHLEKQFKPGMTWENHGYAGWHVDHIRPLASFDLRDPVQQKVCFHYTNLQPLWAPENIEKGSRH